MIMFGFLHLLIEYCPLTPFSSTSEIIMIKTHWSIKIITKSWIIYCLVRVYVCWVLIYLKYIYCWSLLFMFQLMVKVAPNSILCSFHLMHIELKRMKEMNKRAKNSIKKWYYYIKIQMPNLLKIHTSICSASFARWTHALCYIQFTSMYLLLTIIKMIFKSEIAECERIIINWLLALRVSLLHGTVCRT